MIDAARRHITADEIAREADFFSFGTNDLTQLTYGFSRDDIGKFLGAHGIGGFSRTRSPAGHDRRRQAVEDGTRKGRRPSRTSSASAVARWRSVVDHALPRWASTT
jgi:pyruvate,orthophosphate dikinase